MKQFVVAVISFFDNEIKQYKVEAESDFEAAKKVLVEFAGNYKEDEIKHQNSDDYPKDLKSLRVYLGNGEMDISVMEV